MMIRPVRSDADLDVWAALKTAVTPNEPVSADQLRHGSHPDRLLLLAELDGQAVGSGIADRSHFHGYCFVEPRVLPDARGRGVGRSLFEALCEHARGLGLARLTTFVDGGDERSYAFALRRDLVEVDRQVEQVRSIGAEPAPVAPGGIELVAVSARPELLARSYDEVAVQAYRDLPLPGTVEIVSEEWQDEEATLPAGSFAALADGAVVGYAGLLERAEPGTAEHGLTAVRREWRRRGVATALKRAQLAWAAGAGLRELVTWTQRGNEAMQSLNDRLGYVTRSVVLTMRGPLP
jgi:GNAT superfamily N-acetyltransferase